MLAARDPLYPPERVRLPELAVGPVDDAAAAELLRRRAPGLVPPVAAAITHAAAGNPLALVELPATLTAGQRSGIAALELPLAPGGRLQRAFAGRVEALDDQARQALLIAAAHAAAELPVIAAACLRAGTDAGRLADAEAAGLVRLGPGRVSFTHPLIRGMVYAGASAAHRRAAHAAALREDDDRRVWHLAAAATGPDEGVAAALERAGSQAAARRAYAAGADALERAAPRWLTTRSTWPRRLVAASASTSTTPSTRSTRPWGQSPPSPPEAERHAIDPGPGAPRGKRGLPGQPPGGRGGFPFRSLPRKPRHSPGGNARTAPAGSLLSRTAIWPPGRPVTSTQSPLA